MQHHFGARLCVAPASPCIATHRHIALHNHPSLRRHFCPSLSILPPLLSRHLDTDETPIFPPNGQFMSCFLVHTPSDQGLLASWSRVSPHCRVLVLLARKRGKENSTAVFSSGNILTDCQQATAGDSRATSARQPTAFASPEKVFQENRGANPVDFLGSSLPEKWVCMYIHPYYTLPICHQIRLLLLSSVTLVEDLSDVLRGRSWVPEAIIKPPSPPDWMLPCRTMCVLCKHSESHAVGTGDRHPQTNILHSNAPFNADSPGLSCLLHLITALLHKGVEVE